jgi:hypothetical protein
LGAAIFAVGVTFPADVVVLFIGATLLAGGLVLFLHERTRR